MKKQKEQKQNSTLKNIRIVLSAVGRQYPISRLEIPLYMLIEIAKPCLSTLIPSLAIAAITKADVKGFLLTITLALAGYWLLHAFQVAQDRDLFDKYEYTRVNVFFSNLVRKAYTMDYINLEPQARQKVIEKAANALNGNWVGAERLMRESVEFGIKIFGLLAYGSAVFLLDYRVLLVTLLMFVFDVALRNHAIKYSDAHRSEITEVYRKQNYIKNSSMNVSAGKDIRIYQLKHWFHTLHERLCKQAVDYEKRAELRWYFPTVADVVVGFARDWLAYAILIAKVLQGELDVAEFTLYLGIVTGFSNWIYQLSFSFSNLRKSSHEFNDYNEFMATEDVFRREAQDAENVKSLQKTPRIEFRNVSFTYEGSDTPVIKNLSFTLEAGEKVAMVGHNGAGKTTIVKLLCGLYPPDEGEILINGKTINEVGLNAYQDIISVLFQDTTPLAFTIAMNVAACGTEQMDREKVRECLRRAGLWEKVECLEKQEDSYITQVFDEGGIQLSGGEVQKLLLARSIYKESSLLVLDEPTSALDPLAESRIYEEYNALSQDKTSLFISHRLASTKFCNRILFMENGQLVESGSHEELMQLGRKYKEVFDIQSHYYRDEEVEEDEA